MFFGQIFVGELEATNPAGHLAVLHALSTFSLWISLAGLISASNPSAPENMDVVPSPRRTKDFLILTKPWIVALLLVATTTGLVVGAKVPPFSVMFWTILGGALAAGGSSALNQYIDHEVDKHMQRTAHRPLAAGRLTPAEGLAFGLALCIASYYILAGLVNLLAALLSLAGIFYWLCKWSPGRAMRVMCRSTSTIRWR